MDRLTTRETRRVAVIFAVLLGLGIVLVTTLPVGLPSSIEWPRSAASAGWLADRLRNTVLFMPLGAALAPIGLRTLAAVGLGAGLSAVVETVQLGIPGRHPSLADVVANALSTALGFGLSRAASRGLSVDGMPRAVLVIGTVVGASICLVLPGLLLQPSLVEPPHHGQRVPHHGRLAHYDGRLERASIDGIEVTAGSSFPAPDSRALAAGLEADWRLELSGVAGERPAGQAAFVVVGDGALREQLLVGPDGPDLVVRYWCRGTSLGLASARWRARDVLADLRPGDPFALRVEREGFAFRVALDGQTTHIGGLRAADASLLLAPHAPWLERHREGAGAIWLAAVLLPVGVTLASWPGAAVAGLVVALALATGPAGTGLLPATAPEIAGALAGVVIGTVLGRWSCAH